MGSHVYGGVTGNTLVWRSGNVTSRVTVSNDDCFPLVTTTVTTGGVWSLTLSNFQNVTEGIKDVPVSVFDLPDGCPK
ncbi:ependymin-related protein 1-like [Littorina saxatilis]|uniref:ependymin-related protein 1-like n=1 Tax=Littorina saxatilis TaxID=31220 RepID=UPI0038B636FD